MARGWQRTSAHGPSASRLGWLGALGCIALTLLISAPTADATEALPSACTVNHTPEACIAAALTAGFPQEEITVDEYGDFFWGTSGAQAYSTGTNDEYDAYENGAEVAEGHIFRANVGAGGSLAVFVGVHNGTLNSIEAPSDQALVCDYTNKACYGDTTHYYGNPGAPEAPSNTSAPAISGTVEAGATLSATAGSWTGKPTPSYAYQWRRCNSLGESCSSISGATEATYQLVEADVGATIVARVTATNSAGSSSASSVATSVVKAARPALPSACTVNHTPEACIAAALTAGFPQEEITVDEYGDFFWGTSGAQAYSTGTNDEYDAYENGAEVAEGHIFRANVGAGGSLAVFVGVHNGTLNSIEAPSDQALVCDYTNKACYGDTTHYYGNPGAPEAPSNTSAPAISGTVEAGGTLVAHTGTWSGAPAPTFAYQWESCDSAGSECSDIEGATGTEHELHSGDVGTRLRVRVTASNSTGTESATSAASALVVARTPPSNTAVPTISGTARDGQTLTAGAGSWTGTPAPTYAYQWQRCNTAGESCSAVSGATGPSYVLGHEDVGATIRVEVIATNIEGSSSSSSDATIAVAALAPENTARPSTHGIPQQGQTLTAANGSWIGTPTIGYAYQWRRCNSSGVACEDIAGATSESYLLAEADAGATVRVAVTASNAGGSQMKSSEASPVIASPAPFSSATPTVTGTVATGATLTAHPGTWTGDEPISYGYQWEGCNRSGGACSPISGATEATFSPTEAEIGDTVKATVTATNGLGSTEAHSAATVPVEAVAAGHPCDDTWTGPSTGNWGTAEDWAGGNVPGPTDHVCILDESAVAVTATGQGAGWITDHGTLTITGGLAIAGPQVSSIHTLKVEGGTLEGAGEVDVSASFATSSYVTLKGAGSTVIEAGASGSIGATSGGGVNLDERSLINQGTLTVPGGAGLGGSHGAQLVNSGTLVVNGESASENHGLIAGENEATLTNTGTLAKTEGSGTTAIEFAIANEGTVTAEVGRLEFTGGGSSGELAKDSWLAASGASILFEGFLHSEYDLGQEATFAGDVALNANVTAGELDGASADVTSQIGDLTITGFETSTLRSLTFSQPEPNYHNSQKLTVDGELAILGEVQWSSNDAQFVGPGSIVAGPESSTHFNASAWIHLSGGTFVNLGTATWETGGIEAEHEGRFFENYGTFHADQDGANPVVQGCTIDETPETCPVFVNFGTFDAAFPKAPGVSHKIGWEVDFLNIGTLEAPYWEMPRCEWEYSEVPGPGAEACNQEIVEYEGLLLSDRAIMIQDEDCESEEASPCPEEGEQEALESEEGSEEPEGMTLEGETEEEGEAHSFSFPGPSPDLLFGDKAVHCYPNLAHPHQSKHDPTTANVILTVKCEALVSMYLRVALYLNKHKVSDSGLRFKGIEVHEGEENTAAPCHPGVYQAWAKYAVQWKPPTTATGPEAASGWGRPRNVTCKEYALKH